MGGSYSHITDDDGSFRMDLIENFGEAHEALEMCQWMIQHLARQNTQGYSGRVGNAAVWIAEAQREYYKRRRGELLWEDPIPSKVEEQQEWTMGGVVRTNAEERYGIRQQPNAQTVPLHGSQPSYLFDPVKGDNRTTAVCCATCKKLPQYCTCEVPELPDACKYCGELPALCKCSQPLPCPFCGDVPEVIGYAAGGKNVPLRFRVECIHCEVHPLVEYHSTVNDTASREAAIMEWNRRDPRAAVQALLEALDRLDALELRGRTAD